MKFAKLVITITLFVFLCTPVSATYFGGYYGTDWGNTKPPVTAFINTVSGYSGHTTGGPTAANMSNWDCYNNSNPSGIDWWDFVFSCEHGNPWKFWVNDGVVDLDSAGFGDCAAGSWGDYYANWVVLYSCQVVCSPIEKGASGWDDVWIDRDPVAVFDGLHILNGFRTNAYVSPAVNVSTQYAHAICTGGEILEEWFNCVWNYSYCSSTSMDKACSVFYVSCENDTLTSYAADPSSGTFNCWYY